MLLGTELPLDPGWRVVEGDLYNISRRVREYAPDARLVCDPQTGELGLAHFNRFSNIIPGGSMQLARTCVDWRTGEALVGTPDARVITDMRYSDSYQIKNQTVWNRKQRDRRHAREAAKDARMSDWSDPYAERMAWEMTRNDFHHPAPVSVPRGV